MEKAMARPSCSLHPGSKVWRDGIYGDPQHRRQRWVCRPLDRHVAEHNFTEHLPRQRTKLAECGECERAFQPDEGNHGSRQYTYTVRQVAEALIAVGNGTSYRRAASDIRQEASGTPFPIQQPNLVMDWVEAFAPIVTQPLMESNAPTVAVVDSLPFRSRGGPGGQGGRNLFSVLGMIGYDQPGHPIL
jgi:hypothetical protein